MITRHQTPDIAIHSHNVNVEVKLPAISELTAVGGAPDLADNVRAVLEAAALSQRVVDGLGVQAYGVVQVGSEYRHLWRYAVTRGIHPT